MNVNPLLTIEGVDRTCDVLVDVEVKRGRNHPAESFDPATLTCTLIGQAALTVGRGDVVRFTLNAPLTDPTWNTATGTWNAATGSWEDQAVVVILFYGYVTDLAAQWGLDDTGALAPVVKVLAVDPMGRLANTMVGAEPWPAESCVVRAQRIAGLCGITLTAYGTGPLLLARDVDRQPALELLDDVASDGSGCGGVYYDPSTARYVWTLGDERNTTTPLVSLTDCQVLDDIEAAQAVTDLTNDVTVTYGNPQVEVYATDTASVLADGYRHSTISTALSAIADAQARAVDQVRRYGVPAWRITNLTVPSKVLDAVPGLAETLLRAPLGSRLRLAPLPPPAPSYVEGYLEGYTFRMLSPDAYEVELNVSPQQWTGPLLTWDQAVGTWNAAHGSWNEALTSN